MARASRNAWVEALNEAVSSVWARNPASTRPSCSAERWPNWCRRAEAIEFGPHRLADVLDVVATGVESGPELLAGHDRDVLHRSAQGVVVFLASDRSLLAHGFGDGSGRDLGGVDGRVSDRSASGGDAGRRTDGEADEQEEDAEQGEQHASTVPEGCRVRDRRGRTLEVEPPPRSSPITQGGDRSAIRSSACRIRSRLAAQDRPKVLRWVSNEHPSSNSDERPAAELPGSTGERTLPVARRHAPEPFDTLRHPPHRNSRHPDSPRPEPPPIHTDHPLGEVHVT
ncbi:MAG: hypothetical protein R2705_06510 [Ilumatobacteraceae bacterium]